MTAAAAPHAGHPAAKVTRSLRDVGRRHRTPIAVVATVATAGALAGLLAGRRDEFTTALAHAQLWVLAAAAALQVVALVRAARPGTSAIQEAGGADRAARPVSGVEGALAALTSFTLVVPPAVVGTGRRDRCDRHARRRPAPSASTPRSSTRSPS